MSLDVRTSEIVIAEREAEYGLFSESANVWRIVGEALEVKKMKKWYTSSLSSKNAKSAAELVKSMLALKAQRSLVSDKEDSLIDFVNYVILFKTSLNFTGHYDLFVKDESFLFIDEVKIFINNFDLTLVGPTIEAIKEKGLFKNKGFACKG